MTDTAGLGWTVSWITGDTFSIVLVGLVRRPLLPMGQIPRRRVGKRKELENKHETITAVIRQVLCDSVLDQHWKVVLGGAEAFAILESR